MKDMRWVPVPNKHDGEGFRRIMAEKDGNVAITLMAHILGNVAAKSTDPERVIEGTVTVSKLVLASIEGDAT